MTVKRAAAFGFIIGTVFWLFIFAATHIITKVTPPAQTGSNIPGLSAIVDCVKDPIKCVSDVAGTLKKEDAYGVILGLLGLLLQLGLRGEWPTGQLNVGRPKVLDPVTLVTVVVAAMVAGKFAAPFLSGDMRALGIVAFSYFVADAATLGADKISELLQKLKAFIQRRTAAK